MNTLTSARRPGNQPFLRWFVHILSCLALICLSGVKTHSAGETKETFLIRTQVRISSQDTYHYENRASDGWKGEETDRTDACSAVFTSEEKITISGRTQQSEGFCTFAISGGGSQSHVVYSRAEPPEPPEMDRRSWTYTVDPSLYDSTTSQLTVILGNKFEDIMVIPNPIFPSDRTVVGGMAVVAAGSMNLYAMPLFIEPIKLPTNSMSYTLSYVYSTNHTENYTGYGETGATIGNYDCTVTIQRNPAELEAVILPDFPSQVPLPKFEDWLPIGGTNEDQAGNPLALRVILRQKGATDLVAYGKAKFRFELKDVSKQPGICMNFPEKHQAEVKFDLRFHEADGLTVRNDKQSAETDQADLNEWNLVIDSFDYGSYGKLNVFAQLPDGQTLKAYVEGHPEQDFLTIPKDENQNDIGDAWEKAMQVYDKHLKSNWEGTLDPAYRGQAVDGDGISLYEKYRGFKVLRDGIKETFERLDPKRKIVFVRNPDRLLSEVFGNADGMPEGFTAVSQIDLKYVGPKGWTGPGAFRDEKRIVNFNYSADKHVIDQHGLYVNVNTANNPTESWEWANFKASPGEEIKPKPIGKDEEGATYPDFTGPAAFTKHWRPSCAYQVDVYAANVAQYVFNTVYYHSEQDLKGLTSAQKLAVVNRYIAGHQVPYKRKNTIEMSATMAHELGHATGINHHKPVDFHPDNSALADCTIRYYSQNEFMVDPDDRFELASRGHSPNALCRTVFNCWGQLQVSDNPGAAAASGAAGFSPAPSTDADRVSQLSQEVPNGTVLAQPLSRQEGEPAALDLSADLMWPEVVTGDPLRLAVRLHGATSQATSNWIDGVRLNLRQLSPVGEATLILSSNQWPAYAQPMAFDTASLGITNVSRICEWLAPADIVSLQEGRYRLDVAWDGRDSASATLLPESGFITIPSIEFEVRATSTPALRALNHRHLAWSAYQSGDFAEVVAHAQEAVRLDPELTDPLAIETRFLASNAAVSRGDVLEAAQIMDALRNSLGAIGSHFVHAANTRFASLAPELRVLDAPSSTTPARLQLTAVPAYSYLIQRSLNLVDWTSISTNTLSTNRLEVIDSSAPTNGPGYYRVIWTQ